MNALLINIPTNITELNDLIHIGAKLVLEKIGVSLNNTDRKSKPGWNLRLESQIRKLRQQTKLLKHENIFGRSEKSTTRTKRTTRRD